MRTMDEKTYTFLVIIILFNSVQEVSTKAASWSTLSVNKYCVALIVFLDTLQTTIVTWKAKMTKMYNIFAFLWDYLES